jgi:hypothetical protein
MTATIQSLRIKLEYTPYDRKFHPADSGAIQGIGVYFFSVKIPLKAACFEEKKLLRYLNGQGLSPNGKPGLRRKASVK